MSGPGESKRRLSSPNSIEMPGLVPCHLQRLLPPPLVVEGSDFARPIRTSSNLPNVDTQPIGRPPFSVSSDTHLKNSALPPPNSVGGLSRFFSVDSTVVFQSFHVASSVPSVPMKVGFKGPPCPPNKQTAESSAACLRRGCHLSAILL